LEQTAMPLVVFTLGPHRFGVPARAVREVTRAVAITALPRAPAIVEGAINYRGSVTPVLDLRQRFGLPSQALHPDQHFIVAQAGHRLLALRVDRATDLVTVKTDAIEPADVVPGAGYVAGIARLPDGLLVIHDLPAVLALDEAEQLDRALREGAQPAVPSGTSA